MIANIEIKDLDKITQKLEVIEQLLVENTLPPYLPAEKVAEKFGLTTQTLSAIAKEGVINKYKFGDRRIYYCIPEIYKAIQAGLVKPFVPKSLKK